MSRSYKKHTVAKDKNNKFYKKYANRLMRRRPIEQDEEEGLLQHGAHKKNPSFCSWYICDYRGSPTTFEQFYESCVTSWHRWRWRYEPYPDRDEMYLHWLKWYKRK